MSPKTIQKTKARTHRSALMASEISGANDPLEKKLRCYLDEFNNNNQAAHVVASGLRVIGIGYRPVIDHITFRTLSVEKRAQEFLDYGYVYDKKTGLIKSDTWLAKIFRKSGYPSIFIMQPQKGAQGKKSVIPQWVETFGDKLLHHVAILVDDIEQAAFFLEKQNVPMSGSIIGDHGADLRQIFTKPEIRKGKAFTVLELTERHCGYMGFLPPQAETLIQKK